LRQTELATYNSGDISWREKKIYEVAKEIRSEMTLNRSLPVRTLLAVIALIAVMAFSTATLATTNFLYVDSGDGYTMLKNSKALIPPEKRELDSDILQRAIRSVRAITPRVEGRIKRLDQIQQPRPDCE